MRTPTRTASTPPGCPPVLAHIYYQVRYVIISAVSGAWAAAEKRVLG